MEDLVKVVNLSKRFKEKDVLNNINLELKKKEVLAYLGHNGAGKTTTIRIILGLLHPDRGSVFFKGKEIDYSSREFDDMRKSFGVMLDYPAFYTELSGYENLKIFARLYSTDEKRFEENVYNLSEKLEIQDALKNKVKTYSKGMKQKLSFIRAVQHEPEVVFMDEPMSGLDPVARVKMREIIFEMKSKGTSFFIASHDLEEMDKISDYIIILEKGNVVLSSTLKDIKSDSVYYEVKLNEMPEGDFLNNFKEKFSLSELNIKDKSLVFKAEKEILPTDMFNFFNGYSVDVVGFDKKENSLERIYFEVLSRNENR